MRITKEKKDAIKSYILEKIEMDDKIVEKTMEAFEISRKTVFKYIDELLDEGAIRREKRGKYILQKQVVTFSFSRSKNELKSEERIYIENIEPKLKDLPENVKRIWEYAFSEMMNNIIDHSAASKASVSLIQDYMSTAVLMSDNGVGIFKKLKEYFGYNSLDEAISALFKGKLTTDNVNHSGEGIFFSSRVMDTFIIISDNKIFSHDKYDMESIQSIEDYGVLKKFMSNKGTSVYMRLSNSSNKSMVEFFNRFASVEGGFTRTNIVLKNIFDSAPISRSQAKRLCEGLDKFEEVELDFNGLDWMGQGFAHQLFVVFAGQNPGVKLTPLNMCEDVEKMYKHVIN